MKIYDFAGREVRDVHFDRQPGINSREISVADLPQGMYLVQLLFNGKEASKRIVKLN